jgi:bifunctional non-homologous end joining protein LigD
MKKLLALKTSANPFKSVTALGRRGASWVMPKLVAQVNFSEWTEDGHMRHPSFQGLRENKPAKQVTREQEKKPPESKGKAHAKPRIHARVAAKAASRGRRSAGAKDIEVEGVRISHPDKVLYPADGITKRMLAEYYMKVAPRMLPHVAGRAISLVRLPGGLGHQQFFQRHIGQSESPHVRPVHIDMKHDHEPYMVIKDLAGLITLVQIDALEIHIWGSEAKTAQRPDRIVLDFDPAPDVAFLQVKKAATQMRSFLKQLKLTSFIKTTGGKGLHVVVPFQKGPSWDEVKDFSKQVGEAFVEHDPKRFTVNMRKDIRGGKIYIDYLRNGLGASAIAPYSTRARDGAPIALPIRWEQLAALKSAQQFPLKGIQKHLKADPWKTMAKTHQKLPL